MKRTLILIASIVAIAALIAGCGGGGGGSTPPGGDPGTPTPTTYIMTGTVLDYSTHSAVYGAKVTVGGNIATTRSDGTFRIETTSRPMSTTYSVDPTGTTPGYQKDWCYTNGTQQDARSITLPVIVLGANSLGTVYLNNETNPPFPPIFSAPRS